MKAPLLCVNCMFMVRWVAPGEDAGDSQWQHKGYGEELLNHAEERAREAGYEKIAVTSGIGVRDYYRKFGYEQEGAYMTKRLS